MEGAFAIVLKIQYRGMELDPDMSDPSPLNLTKLAKREVIVNDTALHETGLVSFCFACCSVAAPMSSESW